MTSEIPDTSEFLNKQRKFFSDFAVKHLREMRALKEGKVLGKENRDWRNVSEHCLLAGVMAHTLGELLEIPQEDLDEVTRVALTHDWDKRLEKEGAVKGKITDLNGASIIRFDVEKVAEWEKTKSGLVRVTGDDLRDFNQWGMKEKILRFVDSSIGSDSEGRASILNFRERFDQLKRRQPDYDTEVGMKLYGMSLYDKLAEITQTINQEFYQKIITLHPTLASKHPSAEHLTDLVRNTIIANIETT